MKNFKWFVIFICICVISLIKTTLNVETIVMDELTKKINDNYCRIGDVDNTLKDLENYIKYQTIFHVLIYNHFKTCMNYEYPEMNE